MKCVVNVFLCVLIAYVSYTISITLMCGLKLKCSDEDSWIGLNFAFVKNNQIMRMRRGNAIAILSKINNWFLILVPALGSLDLDQILFTMYHLALSHPLYERFHFHTGERRRRGRGSETETVKVEIINL